MTAAEKAAFHTGRDAAHDRMAVTVGKLWRPDWSGEPPLPDEVAMTDGGHHGCVGLCGGPVAA
jgi:hypothetical protein